MNRADNRGRPGRILRSTSRWLVTATVVVSPWLYGSAEPWAFLSLCVLVDLGLGFWLLSLWGERVSGRVSLALGAGMGLLLALLLLQVSPLPPSLVKVLSPLAAETRQTANAILQGPAREMTEQGEPVASTLSLSPSATRRSLFLAIAYFGVFLVISSTISNSQQLRATGLVVVVSGFLISVFAMLQDFSGAQAIYGFYTPRLGGTFFGPFTNRNHFAAYMNLVIGLALGLLPRQEARVRIPVACSPCPARAGDSLVAP